MTNKQFSVLREFFRGYLHQDTLAEYGGALAAAAQYRADADDEHAMNLRREFIEFRTTVNQDDLVNINAEIERQGAAYQFASVREWREFSDVLLED